MNDRFHHWPSHSRRSRLQAGALLLVTGLAIFTVVLAARRGSGAFDAPDSIYPMAIVTSAAGILGLLAGAGFAFGSPKPLTMRVRSVFTCVVVLPVVVLSLVLLPNGSGAGMSWFAASVPLQLLLTVLITGGSIRTEDSISVSPEADNATTQARVAMSSVPNEAMLRQWMSRHVRDHIDSIDGAVAVTVVPGQRNAVVHVPFVPPFDRSPELSAEVVDGGSAEVRARLVQSYGARLEIRLPRPSESEQDLLISYSAVAELVSPTARAA